MVNQTSAIIFFYISCALTAFFGFLLLDAFVLHSTFVLIGVFRELLTIPSLILLPVILVLVLIQWRKDKFKLGGYGFWSALLLLLTTSAVVLATVFE